MPSIEWFPYLGPNRRSDLTVVEITMNFDPGEPLDPPVKESEIREILVDGGVLTAGESFPEQALPDEPKARYASLLAQTTLLFQRKCDHVVSFFSVSVNEEKNRCTVLVEHEHCDVGMTAVKLAKELIAGERKQLTEPFGMFRAFAHERRLPLDTGALINAARRRDIPCNHLERFPRLRNRAMGDCIRLNGLVMFGHGVHRHVMDGTFCLDKSGEFRGLLKNSGQRKAILQKLGVPLLDSARLCGSAHEYHVIVVNGLVTGINSRTDNDLPIIENLHSSVLDFLISINAEVGFAPIVVALSANGLTRPLLAGSSGVVDFELAPNLEHFHEPGTDFLDRTAEAIVDWLFPDNTNARMPIISVTGTNGKTTTTRMISHVLKQAGRKPGFVCTDGIYLDGKKIADKDNCTMKGHFEVLSSKAVDVAVLETHHFGILMRGFGFRWCDIAVCLNVTDDHLGVGYIESVEDMAGIKQALPERARFAAVLNADDPHCQAMLANISAKNPCLVSMESSQKALQTSTTGKVVCFCVLEPLDGEECIVIYDGRERMPVMRSNQMPATFGGTARFNISNAMHAIAACYLAGTDVTVIREAMGGFRTGYETTPGRMNEYSHLPFRVVVDFAHNPDGLRRISEFADNQEVTGRKLVAFAGTATRPPEMLREMGRVLAGHFDFYFCKEHVPVSDKSVPAVAHLLQEGLLESGVRKDQCLLRKHGQEVINEILDSCEPGDLLLLLIGHVEMHLVPTYIEQYSRSVS